MEERKRDIFNVFKELGEDFESKFGAQISEFIASWVPTIMGPEVDLYDTPDDTMTEEDIVNAAKYAISLRIYDQEDTSNI